MKTAVSIPDKVYELAEQMAKRTGKSRSQLYSQALADYLSEHSSDGVTEQLNKVYGIRQSSIEPQLTILQAKSLRKEAW